MNLRGSLTLHFLSQLSDLSLTQFPHLNIKGIYYSFSLCIKIPQGINASMLSRDTDTEETVSECWFLSLPPNKITNSQPGITSHISAQP